MNKILYVLTRPPHPATDGTRVRILGELEMLSKDFIVDILLISTEKINNKSKSFLIDLGINKIHYFKLSKLFCYYRSFLTLFTDQPLQSRYFFNSKAIDWLKTRAPLYQAIYFHTIRLGGYLASLKANKTCPQTKLIMGFNDAISLNYQAASRKASGAWKIIYKIETERIKNYELDMLNCADDFSIVAQRDYNHLRNNWLKHKAPENFPEIHIIRNGIDDELFKYNYAPNNKNLVFMGNLLYPPNRQGLKIFLKNIWPLILKVHPETKFTIIGKGGYQYFYNYKNIKTLGYVEKPYELLIKQSLFISPENFGAGVSTKSLVAMSLTMPVVANADNAIGIDGVKDGENICLINYIDYKKDADKIINALNNENYCKRIGLSGKQLVQKLYSRKNNYPDFKNLFNA